MSFEEALRRWLASPRQVQDWSEVDSKKLSNKDFNVVSAEYAKVKTVDGPPHYTAPDGWEIESVSVVHEEGWMDQESGTSWPSSITVVVTRVKKGPKGQKHRRKDEVNVESGDPIEFMQQLFQLTEEGGTE